MSESQTNEAPSPSSATGETAAPDHSLRNFTIGVLAASAVIVALMYFLQTAAG